MFTKSVIRIIAVTEIMIGAITVSGLMISSMLAISEKSPNIVIFIFTSSVISILLGVGIIASNNMARRLLIFFSGWVLLTKLLVFMGVIEFSGELLKAVSISFKNAVSAAYHLMLIFILNRKEVKAFFPVPGSKETKYAE